MGWAIVTNAIPSSAWVLAGGTWWYASSISFKLRLIHVYSMTVGPFGMVRILVEDHFMY